MTTIAVLPQRTLQPGADFVSTPTPVDAAAKLVMLTINQINWPYTGEDAIWYQLSYSTDGGQRWIPLISNTITDVPTGGPGTIWPAGTLKIGARLQEPGNPNRLIRIDWNALNSYTVSGQVDVT